MTVNLETQIREWDGLAVVSRYDPPSGSWIFICLHDDTLGPCTGGTRIAVYPDTVAALRDAMRLAEGMTHKWAAVGGGFGGGKAVIAVPRPLTGESRLGLLRRYASVVNALGGHFLTGEDLGTSTEDMMVLAERTRHVHGFDPLDGAKVDPSPYTARGVLCGIRSALAEVSGSDALAGRTVLVQGVGHVGRRLAAELAEGGARLLVSDIDERRAERAAAELGAEAVPAERVYATACDVYAPCAVGATLNQTTIPQLACRAVAGAANNQLEEPDDAERLRKRGVVYVPDYIVNAGGALSFAMLTKGVREPRELFAGVETIGATVTEILREAAERDESPQVAARRRVDRALERGRVERPVRPGPPAGVGRA